ncbi:MAG: hypothetical protein Q9182_005392 [Xanthomendoza sp. 2 TL-2023]
MERSNTNRKSNIIGQQHSGRKKDFGNHRFEDQEILDAPMADVHSKENRAKEKPKDGQKPENQTVSGEPEGSGNQPREPEAQRKHEEKFKHLQDAGWIPHLLGIRREQLLKLGEPRLFQDRQWQDGGQYWVTTHTAESPRCMTPKEFQNRMFKLCSLVKLQHAMSMLQQVLDEAATLGAILLDEIHRMHSPTLESYPDEALCRVAVATHLLFEARKKTVRSLVDEKTMTSNLERNLRADIREAIQPFAFNLFSHGPPDDCHQGRPT